ncbi:hypothetical protein TcG_02910 [Trypanosoma cruzi]|nr:hypothetical protein TcG_02910 [Trypanosoma cruzi]
MRAAYEGGRRQSHPFNHPPPIPRILRTAPPTLHPIVQTADGIDEEGGRDGSRNVGDVRVEAENAPGRAIHDFLPHARTADERGELCGLFDGNIRCSAIDPTAARQDAAVHVGNESNPARHDDSGVAKIAARSETKQARPVKEEGMDQVIRSRTDWKERVVF